MSGEAEPSPSLRRPCRPTRVVVALGRALVDQQSIHDHRIGIGRGSKQHLIIEDESVSRAHCEIRFEDGRPVLYDLGTSNGTTVNGRAVVTEPLHPGAEIGVGRFVVIFEPTPAQLRKLEYRVNMLSQPVADAATAYLSTEQIDDLRRSVRREREPHLLVIGHSSQRGCRYSLRHSRQTLGRDGHADISLIGVLLARRQAEIYRSEKGFVIRSLSRLRRVFVNGRPICQQALNNRDQIRIGKNNFQFFD